MSCCEGTSGGLERYPGTGCCGTSCAAGKTGCSASEPRIRSCLCQENVGCLDRADCGGFRPRGTAATGACPGPCQCAEEEAWNRNVPPKPNCEWLSNFSELRRQWSDHGRQNSCKCCNCKPCRTAAPCKPCLPPTPRCSRVSRPLENCEDCCNERLSGGACGQSSPLSLSLETRRRGCSPSSTMHSSGGCPPPSCNRASPSNCCSPIVDVCSLPCDSPSQCSLADSSASPCRPPSSCQPCSPSPRPILKKRSCCQCITGCCMCQPMPRSCNCPPPVQIDARADKECSCDCPSSPECACPPSERKFPKTKVKCPNARLCCPTPRPQPGPKCCCTKCQPCLPPPCDPCTSSKCRTIPPKVKPCCPDSPCAEKAPCRPVTPRTSSPCRPIPPCADCRKMSSPCRPSSQIGNSHQRLRQIRPLNRPRSPDLQCPPTPGCCRSSDEGYGDDDGEADTGYREAQCHCGSSDSRGCDERCDYCCSLNCDDDDDDNNVTNETRYDTAQCDCGNATDKGQIGCNENCDYCCAMNCADLIIDEDCTKELTDQSQCCCDADRKACAQNCDHCCSHNCDTETMDLSDKDTAMRSTKKNRIAAGGMNNGNQCHEESDQDEFTLQDYSQKLLTLDGTEKRTRSKNRVVLAPDCKTIDGCISRHSETNINGEATKAFGKSKRQRVDDSILETPEETDISHCCSQSPKVTVHSAVATSPRSACKLLRSLIRAKSPVKYCER